MLNSVIFFLLYAGAAALCVWLALKRHWLTSALGAASSGLAFVLAYFLSRAFTGRFGGQLADQLKEGFLEVLSLRSDVMLRETAMLNVSAFAVTVLVGMTFFLIMFIISRLIFGVLCRLIFPKKRADAENAKKLPALSLVFSLISFAAVSFAVLYPVGAASKIAVSAAKTCEYKLPASVLTNPVGRLYGIAGRGFFDSLTEVSGAQFINSEEAERGAEIYISLRKVAEGKDGDGMGIERIAYSLRSSYLLTDFSSELVANAANSWKNGREFMNRRLKMPDGRSGELVADVLGILSEWEQENLIQDIDTAINIYKLLRENNILKVTDGELLFEALSEEEFDRQLFLELSRNADFIAVIPKVTRFGIGTAVDAMEMEMNSDYIVEFNAAELTEEDWINEASAFSKLLKRMKILSDDSGEFDAAGLLTDLYELRDSKLLSNILLNLLIQIVYNLQLAPSGA